MADEYYRDTVTNRLKYKPVFYSVFLAVRVFRDIMTA